MKTITNIISASYEEWSSMTPLEDSLYIILMPSGNSQLFLGNSKLEADSISSALNSSIISAVSSYASNAAISSQNCLSVQTAVSSMHESVSQDAQSAASSQASALSSANSASNHSDVAENARAIAVESATSAENSASEAKIAANESEGWFDSISRMYRHIDLGACKDMGIIQGSTSNQLMWTDPDDVVLNSSSLADWEKTELWALESETQWPEYPGYPGAVLLATTQKGGEHPKNSYSTVPFVHSGLTEGRRYAYALFSYTNAGSFNQLAGNRYPLSNTWNWAFLHQFSQAGTLLNYVSIGELFSVRHDDFTHTDGTNFIPVRLMDYDGCTATDSALYPHCAQFQFVDCLYSQALSYGAVQFDAPEPQYEYTADIIAIAGKTYYTKSESVYTALVEGTDWNPGDQVPTESWYEKNKNPNYNLGTNLWDESNIRQYLNSDLISNWWTPKSLWDKAASYSKRKGFIHSLESSLKPCLVPVNRTLARSTAFGGGQYTVSDKIFLPSKYEVFGTENNGIREGKRRWRWYADNSTNNDRVKLLNQSPHIWWLSSAHTGHGSFVYGVTATGSESNNYAHVSCGLAPAFCI